MVLTVLAVRMVILVLLDSQVRKVIEEVILVRKVIKAFKVILDSQAQEASLDRKAIKALSDSLAAKVIKATRVLSDIRDHRDLVVTQDLKDRGVILDHRVL